MEQDKKALRERILGALSLGGRMTYRQIMDATGARNGEVLQAMLPLVMREVVRLTPPGGTVAYALAEGYEWHGSALAARVCVPRAHLAYTCPAHHTTGFPCARAEGHGGRHLAHGEVWALAAWVSGGRYDPLTVFTEAERAALDADAAEAFF